MLQALVPIVGRLAGTAAVRGLTGGSSQQEEEEKTQQKPKNDTLANMGMVGQAGKQKVATGGGTLPAPKAVKASGYSKNTPTDKLLETAVKYLTSINNTLKKQLEFDKKAYEAEKVAAREDIIEKPSTFANLKDRLSGFTEKAKETPLKSLLLGGLGLALLADLAAKSFLDTDELNEFKKNVDDFGSKFRWLFDLAASIGAGTFIGWMLGGGKGAIVGAVANLIYNEFGAGGVFNAGMAGLAGYAGYKGVRGLMGVKDTASKIRQIRAAPRVAPSLKGSGFRDPKTGRAVSREAAAKGGAWLSGPKGQRFVAFLQKRFGKSYVAKKVFPFLARAFAGAAMTATGIGAIPGILWSLINLGMSAYLVYELIDAWFDFQDEEDLKADAEKAGSEQPKPDAEKVSGKAPPLTAKDQQSISDIPADVGKILATIRTKESGGNYGISNPGSSASGAYQFIDSTWKSLTNKYQIGTDYPRAYLAPPQIQDAVAAKYVQEILDANGGDVSKVPLVWYTGNAQGQMSAAALAANRGLTPSQYQADWMNIYTGGNYSPSSYSSTGAGMSSSSTSSGGGILSSAAQAIGQIGATLVGPGKLRNINSALQSPPDRTATLSTDSSAVQSALDFGLKESQKAAPTPTLPQQALQLANPSKAISVVDPNYPGSDSVMRYLSHYRLAA